MSFTRSQQETRAARLWRSRSGRRGFTLIEMLIVIGIIVLLMSIMGVMLTNSVRKAREAATITLIQKIEGLLDERIKGFDRVTKSRDFQRIVETRRKGLEASGIFGVSTKVMESIARKDYFRAQFPQRLEDMPDTNGNYIPDAFEAPPLGDPQITLVPANFRNSDPANRLAREQNEKAESAELLYYMLTRMQVFGAAPVADDEFKPSEVQDTDGDGLMEFVDGWGRPLRFYRWPTRLLKPNGVYGADGQPGNAGVNDDGINGTDDLLEMSKVGTDDVNITASQRELAGFLFAALPKAPVLAGQWDSLSEDPDDPYGLISTEIKRLSLTGILVMPTYTEPNYPTLDTFHSPLVVSAGPDGEVGLFEPFMAWDSVNVGQPYAGDGLVDYGAMGQAIYGTAGNPFSVSSTARNQLLDNLTNRNRRAGKGK